MPVKSGCSPELPEGGHSTQWVPPLVEERAVPPVAAIPVRPPPPEPLDPLAGDPDPPLAAVALPEPAEAVVLAALPEVDRVGRTAVPLPDG